MKQIYKAGRLAKSPYIRDSPARDAARIQASRNRTRMGFDTDVRPVPAAIAIALLHVIR